MGGRPAPRKSLSVNDLRDFLPEDLVLTPLTHGRDVELLQAQLVLERVEGDTRATSGASLPLDSIAAVDPVKGREKALDGGGFGCRCRFPFHNF